MPVEFIRSSVRLRNASTTRNMKRSTNINKRLRYQVDLMESVPRGVQLLPAWSETLAAINARGGLTATTPPSCLTGRTVTGGT